MNNKTFDMLPVDEATALLAARDEKLSPVTVIGTESIRNSFDPLCVEQALNTRESPGVTEVVLNPDAHSGYGAPIGCVLVSPSHIYPGPVGVDIKCSMSLLQLNLPADAVADAKTRRAIINAITDRTPTGAGKGQRSVKKSRSVSPHLGRDVVTQGASVGVCKALGIPPDWARHCEDSHHNGHDGTVDALEQRIDFLIEKGMFEKYDEKIRQLGSYGSGNHFGECEIVRIADNNQARETAEAFGLLDNHVAFLSHCGSRGFGFQLANMAFKSLAAHFNKKKIPFPAGDKQLVYAELGTSEANDFLDDMALGGNFATVNHLLINALILEAFQEVIPGTEGQLVYFISHNIARKERYKGRDMWVHRKGATRAFPANHPALAGTPFAKTGHPILLPGNPRDGSAVLVAEPGAEKSCYSVNHGAGRAMGRKAAIRSLDQAAIDQDFRERDILTNARQYPRDEAPAAYKDFREVLRSVELAGLAKPVASLQARFVIKDADQSYGGAA